MGSMAIPPGSLDPGEWRALRVAQCSHRGPSRRQSPRSLTLLAALLAASSIACDEPASRGSGPESVVAVDSIASEPFSTRRASAPVRHCDGAALPQCPDGLTGPSCTLTCSTPSPDPNVPVDCSFELYCHGDGSVYGLAAQGALLYPGSPDASDGEALAALVAFITTHEEDLGLAPGIEPEHLGLVPVPGPTQHSGGLAIRRFTQTWRSRPVLPPDDLVQVVYGPAGAVRITGQIVDGRREHDESHEPANEALVTSSARHHAHVRTGLPLTQIVIDPPTLVVMPQAQTVAWMTQARHASGSVLARALIDASSEPGRSILPLLSWRPHEVEDLASTTPIAVLTADPATDPAMPNTSVESTLVDGSPLLGSVDDVSGDVQLATEEVVVLDLNGGSQEDLTDVASRILSPDGEFLEASGPAFSGQVTHHLLGSWYARIDDYLTDPVSSRKRWDSALPVYSPGSESPTPMGTFAPRILAFIDSAGNDCPPTAVACADIGAYSFDSPAAMGFPELVHQPPGAAPGYEVTGRIHMGAPGEVGNDVISSSHELGHVIDLFAGPGFTSDIAPDCGPICASKCVEDTSDEAPPLGETIAQLSGMLLLQGSFDPVDFEYCDIVGLYSRNNVKAFDPGPCIPEQEDISSFQRPGACAKADPYCDKPDEPGFRLECCDPALDAGCIVLAPTDCPATGFQRQVPTGLCRTSPGYNTHSIMQAFWQLLNGQHCEPTHPFACQPYVWPGNVPPADAIVPAFLHALRLNPLSYEQLFDDMASHVACTYGDEAYAEVNAVLCAHAIRACDEPPPLDCETCGNGVREGEETCDGQDWAATSCSDFDGYVDGELSCDAATCQLDLGQCLGADDGELDTTAGTDPRNGPDPDVDDAGDDAPAATDTEGASTGLGDGGRDGCACRANLHSNPRAWLLLLLGCLAYPRRSRAWPTKA